MADDRAQEAELAAVMRADLATSGARSDDEVVAAVIASAQSLFPGISYEIVAEPNPLRPKAVLIRMRRRREVG